MNKEHPILDDDIAVSHLASVILLGYSKEDIVKAFEYLEQKAKNEPFKRSRKP